MTQKTFTGTATSSDTLAARSGNSVRELFVSRVSKEVKPDDLKNYVEIKGFTVLNVKCASHNEAKIAHSNCQYLSLNLISCLTVLCGQKASAFIDFDSRARVVCPDLITF